MLLLFDLRLLLHVTGEVQRFASLPAGLCLRPQLVDNIVGQVAPHGFGVWLLAHVHGPETPVAGRVLKKVRRIGGAEEHALPGQLRDVTAIRCAVTVGTQGEELLDASDVCLAESVQL